MQKKVKIINLVAEKFGNLKALELDFEKFKQGVIAVKGNAGAGKSTLQKAIRTTTQGREVLDDPDQYGNDWNNEIQLVDGYRKIFIEAVKKKGETPTYRLYEKDSQGKKVTTPIIDGQKATPANYMRTIATELTFGIKEFLSEDNTTQKKFMFRLFADELKKLGVDDLLETIKKMTDDRNYLRTQCQNEGAYIEAFEREGYDIEQLEAMQKTDISELESQKNEILVKKGKAEGDGNAEYERKKSAIIAKGQEITEKVRGLNASISEDYHAKLDHYNQKKSQEGVYQNAITKVQEGFKELAPIIGGEKKEFIAELQRCLTNFINEIGRQPVMPVIPEVLNGKLNIDMDKKYDNRYRQLIEQYLEVSRKYQNLTPPEKDLTSYDNQIQEIDQKITIAKSNNKLVDRYSLNRHWVEADAKLKIERNKLAAMYAKIDTGVPGLKMKPFFDDSAKTDIKTVYNGEFDPEFFRNDGSEDRLLVSYSSTQRPIIGILLQVARLKRKEKILPYIFLDDVPMDKKSYEIISKIAAENDLTVITSMTGDFTKEKLTENEILIEGGEVFFKED